MLAAANFGGVRHFGVSLNVSAGVQLSVVRRKLNVVADGVGES